MSVLKYLDKKFELIIMAGFLVLFTVLMFANVVLRFLFNGSIVWAYELCRYCLVGSTFFSIPINRSTPLLTSGSPPVILTLLIPMAAACSATSRISS